MTVPRKPSYGIAPNYCPWWNLRTLTYATALDISTRATLVLRWALMLIPTSLVRLRSTAKRSRAKPRLRTPIGRPVSGHSQRSAVGRQGGFATDANCVGHQPLTWHWEHRVKDTKLCTIGRFSQFLLT